MNFPVKNLMNLKPFSSEIVVLSGCFFSRFIHILQMKYLSLFLALKNTFLNSSTFISCSKSRGASMFS